MSDEMPSKIDSKTVFLKEEEKLVDCAYEEIDNWESKDSLIRVIQNLADNRLKSRNILAVDDSNNTLQEITKVVSKSLTTGKVRILKEEEALLDRDRKQSDFDQLTVDLHLDPVSIKEMHNRWSAEAGLVENIDHIIRECRESRQLVASLEEVKMEEQELLEAKATPLRNRLMKHVMPTLTRALIDCVKVRPEDAIDVIMSQEEEEVEDISPLQSQLLFSQPLTDTQTSDFEAAPVDQISSPLLHESENLTRSLSQSSHEVQAEQVDNQKNRSQTKLDKQPFSGMISLTATLSFLILCGLCLSVSDAQQCKADQKTCSTDGPARLDICQPHRTTAELFKITSVGTEIFTSGVCRCRLSNLMANGGFGIVVNNFSCPVNGCPWRLQIIVNGCLKAQFCCTDIWKGYEILYFQPTDHVTSVSLQIAQLAEPPEEFGTVSVAIRFDGHKRRLAQMTCGITTFGKSLKKCAPMPELKHAPESFVPVRQQENMMVLDICKPACSSQNPMTFGMNVGALHGPLVCSSKVSAVVSPNVFKVTISEFVCLNRCSYQLMIIIGPCIVQTFCCNIEWQPLTKMIENVNNEAVVQVSKSVDEPEALTFSLTILVGDGTARPVSMASFQSGYTNTSTAAFCHLLTGSTAASTFRQTKAEETVSQNTSGPFDGAVTDDRSAEGQRANVASGMSGGTPVPLEQRLWSVIFLRILQLIAFSGGGGSALRLIKKLIHAFGIDQNGPMQNTLAAAMNHYVTNNPGSLIDKAFRSMQSVAANGYGVVKGIIVFLCGGFVCVYIFNLATASAAFIASKFGWW